KPGEISPFSVLFTKDDRAAPFARYVIEVRSKKADFQPSYTYRDLSVLPSPQARQDQYGFIKISGRVRNNGGQAAKFVQVYAVFYDQQGSVVGLASGYAETANDAPLAARAQAARDPRPPPPPTRRAAHPILWRAWRTCAPARSARHHRHRA